MSYPVRQERVYLRLRALTSRSLIGLITRFATQDGIPAVARRPAPVDAGRHADRFGEAGAEGAQRRAADLETDLGYAEVAATQQRPRCATLPGGAYYSPLYATTSPAVTWGGFGAN